MPTTSDPPSEPDLPPEDRTLILSRREMGSGLPVGHRLQEFEIEGVIGEGGFSIVYRVRDTRLDRHVAIKEYIPSSLAYRASDGEVAARSERHRETYQLGLRSFINEARLLASFDHPSLVKVYRFWEENGTAYMVMPYYKGPTLRKWLTELGTPPSESWLRLLAAPLIDVLELIHRDNCYHRDVAPDNILLLVDRAAGPFLEQPPRPLLLDFGAARRVIGDATQSLTVILKTGYAPVEQYAQTASMRQGPWTDVYALCAVLYTAVTGHAPAASVGRLLADEMESATQSGGRFYTPQFLAAIDAGLAVKPDERPQTMAELRRLFDAPVDAAAAEPGTIPIPMLVPIEMVSAPASQVHPATAAATVAVTEIAPQRAATVSNPPAVAAPAVLQRQPEEPSEVPYEPASFQHPPVAPVRAPATESKHANLVAIASVAALVLAAALWWWWSNREVPVLATPPSTQLPAPAPVTETPANPPAIAAAPATAADNTAPKPPVPLPVTAAPFSVVAALQDMVKRGDPALAVNAVAEKSKLTIGRDRLQLRIKSSEPGYLYLFLAGTDKNHFYLLFPNQRDKNNRVGVDQEIAVPRQGFSFEAAGPPGTNHIVAMVSRRERDLSGTGLRRIVSGEVPEFDLEYAEQRWKEQAGAMNPFVGKAICPKESRCDERYGAALLEIEEVSPAPAK